MADDREPDDGLDALDAALGAWNREQSDWLQELIRTGTPAGEALQALIERQRATAAEGRGPVDYADLHARIAELCRAFRDTDDAGRMALRAQLGGRRNVLAQFYGFIHHAAARLRESGDLRWLDLALAAAALEGGQIDWRDLYVALGELWLAADHVHVNPRSRFTAAAAMADDTLDSTGHSPRGLITAFPHSAHLHSIRRKR